MNCVEPFRLLLSNPKHFHTKDIEPGMLDHAENVAGCILGDRVRLDDAECALQSLHTL